jgi:hypothetical protein
MLQTITGWGDIRLVQTTTRKLNQTDTNYFRDIKLLQTITGRVTSDQ